MKTETDISEAVTVLSDDELSGLQKNDPKLKPASIQHIDQCLKFYSSAYEPDKDVRAILGQLRFGHSIRAAAEKMECNAIYYRRQPIYSDNGNEIEACALVEFYRIER
ncbi:MAG: hypothetical protein V1743_01545 [Nanoarchaeota archaeon]